MVKKKTLELSLTEHQILRYQRRLSHYLADYEYRTSTPAKDIAEKLGIHLQNFYKLRADSKPYQKFVNSLDYIARLASLDQMGIREFLEYLEGEQDKVPARKPPEWQKSMIEGLEPISLKVRAAFAEFCHQSVRDGKRKLEAILKIGNILKEQDIEAVEGLLTALERMT